MKRFLTFSRLDYLFWSVVLIIGALCSSGYACAATGAAAITSTPTLTYTDGSPLALTDIVGYSIDCQFTPTGVSTPSACVGSVTSVTGSTAAASVTVTYPASTGGKACFRMATKTATSISALSPLGASSCKDLPALNPSAPGAVTVTITLALKLTSDSPITVAMSEPVLMRQ